MLESGINALRKLVNHEDKCNKAIMDALNAGPKRVRIASREELKIEVNKYKNHYLRLMAEMKKQGMKVPNYVSKSKLEDPETGIRDEEEENADLKDIIPGERNDTVSNGTNNLDVDGDGVDPLEASGDMTADQLLSIKEKLEERIS